jgi:BirA family biotin operon repressor/biotin-[acetyl-CoA-carboxylase] ligase
MARLTFDGVTAAKLAERWGVPQVGLFRSLPSVLDAVHELAAQDAPAGLVLLAEEQTAGRGRDGRIWHSPPGGIWLGMLLRPAAQDIAATSIRAGLALTEALDALAGRPVSRLKWPNDVLVRECKLAGILCEGRWQGEARQWLALGIGINVANAIPPELAGRAITLADVLPRVRRIDLLDRLIPVLCSPLRDATPESVWNKHSDGTGGRLTERELAAFAARDWLRGRQIARPIFGRAAGIAPDGSLLVDSAAGTVTVRGGHVELA